MSVEHVAFYDKEFARILTDRSSSAEAEKIR